MVRLGMKFEELDQYKAQDNKYEVIIPALQAELRGRLEGVKQGEEKIEGIDLLPNNLANKFNTSRERIIKLLEYLAEEELLKPIYSIYCEKEDAWMSEYDSLAEIPDEIYCLYHDKEHKRSKYYIEMIFRFTEKVLDLDIEKEC